MRTRAEVYFEHAGMKKDEVRCPLIRTMIINAYTCTLAFLMDNCKMIEQRTSLIIPANNEATRISCVIEAGLNSDCIDEVIVIDDGSIDLTSKVVSGYPEVRLIKHDTNRGKGEAIQSGYLMAKILRSTDILILDADLNGLKPQHIKALVDPIVTGDKLMTIGIIDRPLFIKKNLEQSWGAISGQRGMHINVWEHLSERYRKGFKVEAALNAMSRLEGWNMGIERVALDGVHHVGQREKQPDIISAGVAYIQRIGAAGLTYTEYELRHRLAIQ